jgi:hypothetical protein
MTWIVKHFFHVLLNYFYAGIGSLFSRGFVMTSSAAVVNTIQG